LRGGRRHKGVPIYEGCGSVEGSAGASLYNGKRGLKGPAMIKNRSQKTPSYAKGQRWPGKHENGAVKKTSEGWIS